MGWFTWFWDAMQFLGFSNKTGKILFLGLDNAGKTTLLGKLATDQIHTHRPTFNPNVEELQLGGIKLKTIDMGGHVEARRLWKDYFTKVDGVVFIVDAAHEERLEEAKKELDMLLQTEELARTPFVILGNKIDLPQTIPEEALKARLGLTGLTTGKQTKPTGESRVRPLEVFMCSVVKKVGYGDAFRWLSQYLAGTA
jgi:GTP-binding protein SAR1